MKINNIDTSNKIFIVAEIGNNHEGQIKSAFKMIDKAKDAGADAVKFQTFIPELFSSNIDKDRFSRLQSFQFSHSQFEELSEYAKEKGIIFFATPLDLKSATFLKKISPIFKIASGDNNFIPLINKILDFKGPLIISTGLLDINDLKRLHNHINKYSKIKYDRNNLAFLHCVSSYPVPPNQANLKVINTLENNFKNVTIGYSDHTIGPDACIMAASLGARIIEKHFTLDNNFSDFRDHKLSSNPLEFKYMVEKIRANEKLFGDGDKKIQQCEKDLLIVARRSLSSNKDLQKGDILNESHLIWIRPGDGIKIGDEARFLGKKLNTNIKKGEILKPENFD